MNTAYQSMEFNCVYYFSEMQRLLGLDEFHASKEIILMQIAGLIDNVNIGATPRNRKYVKKAITLTQMSYSQDILPQASMRWKQDNKKSMHLVKKILNFGNGCGFISMTG